MAYDAGILPAEHAAEISGDARFHYELFMDWTPERLALFLGEKLDAFDAGTMPPQEEAQMIRTMPDWLTDAARIFCGRAPASWCDQPSYALRPGIVTSGHLMG